MLGQAALQPFHLLQQRAGVQHQHLAVGRGRDAPGLAREQGRAQRGFHGPHARAGRGQAQARGFGTGRDAAGLHDVEEEAQVDEVEAEAHLGAGVWRAFCLGRGWLCTLRIFKSLTAAQTSFIAGRARRRRRSPAA